MEINVFVQKIAEQFVNTPADVFSPETKFREVEEWDSLISLCVLSMIKDNYGFFLDPKVLKSCSTIRDIYDAVEQKSSGK